MSSLRRSTSWRTDAQSDANHARQRLGRQSAGWGATVVSVVVDEGFQLLDAPVRRVASANVPLPFADTLENEVIPTADKVVSAVKSVVNF